MMKFLHLADLHLASTISAANWSQTLRTQADLAVWQALEQLFKQAEEETVDFVLLAGDILEASLISDLALEKFINLLSARRSFWVLAVAGNHDPLTAFSPWQQVLAAAIPQFHLFSSQQVEAVYFSHLNTAVYGYSFPTLYQREEILPSLKQLKQLYVVEQERETVTVQVAELTAYLPKLEQAFAISLVHASPEKDYLPTPQDAYLYNPLKVSTLKDASIAYAALGHFHSPVCNFLQSDPATQKVQLTYQWEADGRLNLLSAAASVGANALVDASTTLSSGAAAKALDAASDSIDKAASVKDLDSAALKKLQQSLLQPQNGTIAAWPGSFQARNFGENGRRGYFSGTLDAKRRFSLEWRAHAVPLFNILNYDLSDAHNFTDLNTQLVKLLSTQTALLTATGNDLNFWRIILQGNRGNFAGAELAKFRAEFQLRQPNVDLVDQSHTVLDLATLASTNDIVARLLKIAQEQATEDENLQKEALELAWQALQTAADADS